MIVLDASVLIGYLHDADSHHAAAARVLLADDEFGVHPITLAEALVFPTSAGRAVAALRQLRNIGVHELDRVGDEALRLARLRVEARLKMPDCCVLLAAESVEGALATFDDRLAGVARSRGIEVLGADG